MQSCSDRYKEEIKNIKRERGYIKAYIGVINSEAQKRANVNDSRNAFEYYSNLEKPFDGFDPETMYATQEENFTKVDGSMYFLPEKKENVIFNNGIVTKELLGTVYVVFNLSGLDIKGLTIDWGEYYPVDFTIENDEKIHKFTGNEKRFWRTEEVFNGTSFLKITPTKMVNGQGRLRILKFTCGIANTFTNNQVMGYTFKDYVSPISESLPSQDMTLTVDNYNQYYSADNPDSAIAYMEQGQEIEVSFGYDLDGKGNIEWMPPNVSYLKSWNANDREAKFVGVDRFDYMTGKYYRGKFSETGISLYDLAIDVFADAGVDEREYYIDPYLKKVKVNNPMPVVKHTEALQIIANAGRCILFQNREKKIQIKSLFTPDIVAESDDQEPYSDVREILKKSKKKAYASQSNDFSVVDETVYFLPSNSEYLNIGYVSNSVCDENGIFSVPPQITLTLEAGYTVFGLLFTFRNVSPKEFMIKTYYDGNEVQSFFVSDPDIIYNFSEELKLFDKLQIIFTKGHPNSRITLDEIEFGNATDYKISYREIMENTPTSQRQDRIKSISVQKTEYVKSTEEKDLKSENIILEEEGMEYIFYFTNPSYGYSVIVGNPEEKEIAATSQIIDSSAYYAKVKFTNISPVGVNAKITIKGYEYLQYFSNYVNQYNTTGLEKEWKNPLISTDIHASDIEEWIASYFLGDVDYNFKWRGDPRVDAYDLFFLQRKNMNDAKIRSYENSLSFNGGWSGNIKARKVE